MGKLGVSGRVHLVVVCVLYGCVLDFGLAISRPTEIVLENNEYKHILVAINDNVHDSPAILQGIKDAFTKGSAFLYSATHQRAVFRDVTILVPASWGGSYDPATTQVFNNADVIFSSPLSPAPPPPAPPAAEAPDEPGDGGFLDAGWIIRQQLQQPAGSAMTRAYAGCGHPGVRVILTTDIFDRVTQAKLGPPEKILVHEWAHFRWGVFDEYAVDGEPHFYFSTTTGKLEGIRCTELQQGIIIKFDATGHFNYCRGLDPSTGLYPEGCLFQPYPAGPQTSGVVASIMDRVNVRPIIQFCDDDQSNTSTRHNYDAPSRHNRLCGHRSVWDVISSTADFANSANPSRPGVNTAPVFNVVQARRTRRMVLTLDTSASMVEDQKVTRMKQAVGTFINDGVASDTLVGLTTFNVGASVLRAPLMPLNSTRDRQALVDQLPDTLLGATDIAAGLAAAAQLLTGPQETSAANSSPPPSRHARSSQLTSLSHHASGGHVVMITDGQDNSGPDILSVLPSLKESGVIVTVVVLGGAPTEELEQLALQTGGRVYCDHNHKSSTAAMDAFFDIMENCQSTFSPFPIQILSEANGLYPHDSSRGTFYIGPDLGRSTTVLVSYDVTVPAINVTSPTGRVYNYIYPEYSLDHRLQIAKILIPGIAESGQWTYEILNSESYQRVSVLILSSTSSSAEQPVYLSGTLMLANQSSRAAIMHIFAEATRGDKPVTGLEVTALVHLPDGTSQKVALYDNGAGADIVENDGVYSRYFSELTKAGLYTVRLTATGHGDQHGDPGVDEQVPVDPRNKFVQRSATAGYVVIKHTGNSSRAHASVRSVDGQEIDSEAPVRISDLRVVRTSQENQTVVLSWRASGDDADKDTASRYEVYMAPSAYDLIKGSDLVTNLTQDDVVQGNLVAPKPFGSREYLMVRIPAAASAGSRFVFAVVAVDEAGNKGSPSNYVTVGLGRKHGPGLGTVPDVTDWKYWADGERQLQATDVQYSAPKNHKLVLATVLGTTSGLLVIVIVVTVLVSAVTEWRKKRSQLRLSLPTTVTAAEKKMPGGMKGTRHTVNGSVLSLKVFSRS